MRTRRDADRPSRSRRASPSECWRSGPSRPLGSAKTVATSSNETPCLARFLVAFRGSHSNTIEYIHNNPTAQHWVGRLFATGWAEEDAARLPLIVRQALARVARYQIIHTAGQPTLPSLLVLKRTNVHERFSQYWVRRQLWLRTTMPDLKDSCPRQPTVSVREPLWTLGKGPRRLACILVDHGADGAEYRLLVDGAIYVRRRFGRVDLAVLGAADLLRQFKHDGWTDRSPGGGSPPDAVTRSPDVERDVAALIQRSKDLHDEAEELHRIAEASATKAARLRADVASQRRP